MKLILYSLLMKFRSSHYDFSQKSSVQLYTIDYKIFTRRNLHVQIVSLFFITYLTKKSFTEILPICHQALYCHPSEKPRTPTKRLKTKPALSALRIHHSLKKKGRLSPPPQKSQDSKKTRKRRRTSPK